MRLEQKEEMEWERKGSVRKRKMISGNRGKEQGEGRAPWSSDTCSTHVP